STEFRFFNPEKWAAKYPDATLHTTVMTAAIEAHSTAPPNDMGSMESPKLKKNIAPKKSLKGSTSCSMRLMYWESASTKPAMRAPMASATWMVSENPATIKSRAKITRTNSSEDLSW